MLRPRGGGVDVWTLPWQGTEQFLVNNTIFDNTAQSDGGGLGVANGANVVALNNIFWSNTANTGCEIDAHYWIYYRFITL